MSPKNITNDQLAHKKMFNVTIREMQVKTMQTPLHSH